MAVPRCVASDLGPSLLYASCSLIAAAAVGEEVRKMKRPAPFPNLEVQTSLMQMLWVPSLEVVWGMKVWSISRWWLTPDGAALRMRTRPSPIVVSDFECERLRFFLISADRG